MDKLTNKNQDYWETWFASYSQKFSEQLEKKRSSQAA
jgi:hypothetical protein